MKKKTVIRITVCAAALALIAALLPLALRAIYHRSPNATLLMWQFHKNAYTTEAAFEDYLAQKRAENAEEYSIPEDAEITVSVVKGEYAGMPVYVLHGAAEPDGQVIWYFTGGSYIDEPRGTHWTFLNALAEDTGAAIFVPLYPKLPDADAETAYAALTEAYTSCMTGMVYGELVFMGDSAGGGMALSFAMQLRDASLTGPDRLILLSPWVDVTMTNGAIPAHAKKDPALDSEMLRQLGVLWAGELDPSDPVVSPLYGDLSGLGRIYFFTTDGELLYPDHVELERALTGAGAEHEMLPQRSLFHCWPLYAYMGVPESVEAYNDIVSILLTGEKLPR